MKSVLFRKDYVYIYIYIWSNYSDLTRPHPKWWFSKGNPLISGKPRLVEYYNLARYIYIYTYLYILYCLIKGFNSTIPGNYSLMASWTARVKPFQTSRWGFLRLIQNWRSGTAIGAADIGDIFIGSHFHLGSSPKFFPWKR